MEIMINSLLEKNKIPIIMLAGDCQTSFGRSDVSCSFNNVFYSPPPSLREEVETRVSRLIELSKKEGFMFFDDTLARLDAFSIDENGKMYLNFSKTTYFHFAALNKGFNEPISGEKNTLLRSLLEEKPLKLETSKLPNPLGVIVSLVLEPEMKIVLIKRSTLNFESSGMMSTPIGGSLSLGSGDINDSGVPGPFETIIREAKEETGLDINEEQISFFGLGRDLLTLKPELLGEVRINMTEKELRQKWLKKPIDWWETEERFFVDISTDKLIPYLKSGNWSSAGWTCTFFSMLKLEPDLCHKLDYY